MQLSRPFAVLSRTELAPVETRAVSVVASPFHEVLAAADTQSLPTAQRCKATRNRRQAGPPRCPTTRCKVALGGMRTCASTHRRINVLHRRAHITPTRQLAPCLRRARTCLRRCKSLKGPERAPKRGCGSDTPTRFSLCCPSAARHALQAWWDRCPAHATRQWNSACVRPYLCPCAAFLGTCLRLLHPYYECKCWLSEPPDASPEPCTMTRVSASRSQEALRVQRLPPLQATVCP